MRMKFNTNFNESKRDNVRINIIRPKDGAWGRGSIQEGNMKDMKDGKR